MTIVDIVAARATSESLAYVCLADGTPASELRWSFADTASRARAYAAHLRDRGIRAGHRVVLATNPSLEYIAAFYGIMRLGAMPVPCFPPLRAKDLDRFQSHHRRLRADGHRHRRDVPEPIEALRGRLESAGLAPIVVYADQVTRSDDAAPVATAARRPRADPVHVGLDRIAERRLPHPRQPVEQLRGPGRSMGPDPHRVGFSWLPPYHDMGLIGTIILSMYHGWPLVLMSPMHFVQEPRRWLKAINDYRVSITVGPNFSLDLCADALPTTISATWTCLPSGSCTAEPSPSSPTLSHGS